MQPPPRGCVLKQNGMGQTGIPDVAAASARLCVETQKVYRFSQRCTDAAASARLCVETPNKSVAEALSCAAASARLCVETLATIGALYVAKRSRLRAAVC